MTSTRPLPTVLKNALRLKSNQVLLQGGLHGPTYPCPIGSNMSCAVYHMIEMEEEIHHPGILRPLRNQAP